MKSDAEIHTERPRILLASAGFSTELTTSVLWLCDTAAWIFHKFAFKLQLYRNQVMVCLLDTSSGNPVCPKSDRLLGSEVQGQIGRWSADVASVGSSHAVELEYPEDEAFLSADRGSQRQTPDKSNV